MDILVAGKVINSLLGFCTGVIAADDVPLIINPGFLAFTGAGLQKLL